MKIYILVGLVLSASLLLLTPASALQEDSPSFNEVLKATWTLTQWGFPQMATEIKTLKNDFMNRTNFSAVLVEPEFALLKNATDKLLANSLNSTLGPISIIYEFVHQILNSTSKPVKHFLYRLF